VLRPLLLPYNTDKFLPLESSATVIFAEIININ
jgi:hypothetical protein